MGKQWAEKKVEGYGLLTEATAAAYIKAEHARTLRILARLEKDVQKDQHVFTNNTKTHLMMMLATVRAAISKGRR